MAEGAGPKHADSVVVLPYRGYGNAERLVLPGRVLRDKPIRPAREGERRWRNFVAFLKRIESDEVPWARLCARFRGAVRELRADREGYFRLELPAPRALAAGWHTVELELAAAPTVHALGRVLVPPANARFAVVSDIDDTVVQTHVMSKVRMLLTVALSNARTRKPFAGVAAFYRALQAGGNPFFYVSKSPWNLYVPLAEYLEVQGLPEGPLFLRNLGLRMPRDHKCTAIGALLKAYPRLPFILIGEVARTGCQLVLAPDSEHAAVHAAAEGLIATSALRAVRAERRLDA